MHSLWAGPKPFYIFPKRILTNTKFFLNPCFLFKILLSDMYALDCHLICLNQSWLQLYWAFLCLQSLYCLFVRICISFQFKIFITSIYSRITYSRFRTEKKGIFNNEEPCRFDKFTSCPLPPLGEKGNLAWGKIMFGGKERNDDIFAADGLSVVAWRWRKVIISYT